MEGDLCLSGLKEALGVLEEGVISFLNQFSFSDTVKLIDELDLCNFFYSSKNPSIIRSDRFTTNESLNIVDISS